MFDISNDFWVNWLGVGYTSIEIPIPFCNGLTLDLITILNVFSICLVVWLSVWLIFYIFKAILNCFRGGM